MSMNDVIDKIALTAEQYPSVFDNALKFYSGRYVYDLLSPEEGNGELSPERIRELDQQIRDMGGVSRQLLFEFASIICRSDRSL